MNQKECLQNADFLSIALEELERENYDTAAGFIGAVHQNLLDSVDE